MKIKKIPRISKFWNCSSIWYSALFGILSIFILPFDINFILYYSDSRKFGRSKFARSLIFKFEIAAILQFYCSKFWPSPVQISVSLSHFYPIRPVPSKNSFRLPKCVEFMICFFESTNFTLIFKFYRNFKKISFNP